MKASKSEEELMNHIWALQKAYMKDILDSYPEPKPATTTVATLLKRLRDKGLVDFNSEGKGRLYFALVTKKEYFGNYFNGLLKNFFNDSKTQFASFFTQEANLSKDELQELKKMIDQELKKK